MRRLGLVLLAVFLAAVASAVVADNSDPVVKDGTRVLPVYPPAALAAGFQGVVSVAAVVYADGTLGAVEVIDNSAPGLGFDAAALSAIKNWKFDPARVEGTPVDAVGAFVFRFESAGRYNPDTLVSARLAGSRIIGDGIGKGPGPVLVGSGDSMSPAVVREPSERLSTPQWSRMRGMYDRSKVLRPQTRGVSH